MSEKVDLKKTYLAIVTMLLAVLCVDLYMVVIKFLGDDYSVIPVSYTHLTLPTNREV